MLKINIMMMIIFFGVFNRAAEILQKKINVISTSRKIDNKTFWGGYVKARIVELNNDCNFLQVILF